MATTLRRSDSAAEIEIGKFLDRNFYPDHVKNVIRYDDLEHQMLGIDVKFDFGHATNMLVDEKAAVQYVNKGIPTFAFEIDFLLSSGQLVDGWLFDENKRTQYYLLAWVWANKEKDFSVDDITKLEVLLIDRQKIIVLLAKHDIDSARATRISAAIRNDGKEGVLYKSKERPFYFYYSPQLAEQPVNIVIHKKTLIELAIGRYTVTPK